MNKAVTFLTIALLTIPTYLFAAQSQNLESILLEAASAGNTDMVRSFLENGANIEVKNDVGATPLIFASAKGQVQVVAMLLEKGANVNAKTTSGITPLMAAASGGYADVVKLLLAKGANVSAKDQQGRTALSMAEASGESQVADLLKSAQKSSAPEQPRVASQDRSYSRQRSVDLSESAPADSESSGPMPDFSQESGAPMGQPGGLLNDPIVGQLLSQIPGFQQSAPGNVAAIQNINPGAQMQVPAQGGNAPNQPPAQGGNVPNQPPGNAQGPAGQAKGADPNLVTTPFTAPGGLEGTKTFNRTTGETQITATQKDPETGLVTHLNTTQDKSGKLISGTMTQTVPDSGANKGGVEIVKGEAVDGKLVQTSVTHVSAKGDSSKTTNFDPKDPQVKTSEVVVRASGSTTTTNYGGCNKDGTGCKLVSNVDTDPKTGKQTTTKYDPMSGKVIDVKVTDIPKDQQQNAAMLRAKQNQANLAGTKQQNLLGKNLQGKDALANKLQGKQANVAGDKQKGLASNKKQVQADVLNQIQNKPGANLKTGALDPKKAGQAVQLNPQPLPPGPPPDKLIGKSKLEDKFTGVKPHFDQKFQTGGNKNLKQDFNKQATTHGNAFKERVIPQTQSSNQFSEGTKHKTQNMPMEQFKAKTKSQNFNQPAGGQLQKWNR
jgi:uncharacterized protein